VVQAQQVQTLLAARQVQFLTKLVREQRHLLVLVLKDTFYTATVQQLHGQAQGPYLQVLR
jgi:hypothetical protein